MGRARVFSIAGAAAVALLMISGAGAAPQNKGLDLSSPAAIDAYLQTIGVDPASVVRQAGLRNYAGPNCPGAGWTCTTSTMVVQVAALGGENLAECDPDEEDPNTCLIVQTEGTNNKAHCTFRDTTDVSEQHCVIAQDGDRNTAIVHMTIDQNGGPTQTAQQTADVDQNATQRNKLEVHQVVRQRTSTGGTQKQDAYQLADVDQTATGSDNYSHIHQSQDQQESGTAAAQMQNTEPQELCRQKNANQCAHVNQDVVAPSGGTNESHLHQAIGERQSTSALVATQTQGDSTNGNEGDVHQVNPPDVGRNHDVAHQTLVQRASGPDGTTTQAQRTDPSCCGVSQIGGAVNREFINQSTTQSASEDDAVQVASLHGEVHEVPVDEPDLLFLQLTGANNRCKIDHHGRNNSGGEHFSSAGEGVECAALFRNTTCASGPTEIITIAQDETPPCVSAGSDDEDVEIFALPATAGADVAMPNYDAEPADFSAPGW